MNYLLYEVMDRLSIQLHQLGDCLSDNHKAVMSQQAIEHLENAMNSLYQAYNEMAGEWYDEQEREQLNLNCKSVQKRLIEQWGYKIDHEYERLKEQQGMEK